MNNFFYINLTSIIGYNNNFEKINLKSKKMRIKKETKFIRIFFDL